MLEPHIRRFSMSTIIAGHFQLQDEVAQARGALINAGFPEERICGFFLNQPGQHNLIATGGDHAVSAGAKETGRGTLEGAATGGAIGVAVGAVTAPVTGPVGPIVGGLVGAHVGSLFSFTKMKEKGEREAGGENQDEPRKPGMVLAVALAEPGDEARALAVLRQQGAHHLERAQGTVEQGDWIDFDPGSTPVLIH
jgi:hypothetical protein